MPTHSPTHPPTHTKLARENTQPPTHPPIGLSPPCLPQPSSLQPLCQTNPPAHPKQAHRSSFEPP